MLPETAIILAGGLGTRLAATVSDVPKPMAPIAGRPFLEHQMEYWIGQGITRFILSVGYRRQIIMDHFGDKFAGASIAYAIEETPLDTGGGLLLALDQLDNDDTCLVLNGDTFFAVDLAVLAKFHQQSAATVTLSLFAANEAGRYMQVETAPDGRIIALNAGPGAIGAPANGGVYLMQPAELLGAGFAPGAKVSLEKQLFPALHAAGHEFYGLKQDGAFIDIGLPADYFRAGEMLGKPLLSHAASGMN